MISAVAAITESTLEAFGRVAELEQLVAQLQRENQLLQQKLHYGLHRQFGRSAERFDASQSGLFDPPTDEGIDNNDEQDATEVVVRRKKGGRRKALKELPRVRVEHDLAAADKHCQCRACLERIGEETSEQYDVIPPVFQVLKYVRFKYACPVCDTHGVTTGSKGLPDPLPRHQVSAGLLAWLGTSKYVDGLPLQRFLKTH